METGEEVEQVTADLYRRSRATPAVGFRGWLAKQDLGGDISVTKSRMGPMAIAGTAKDDYDYLLFRMHTAGSGYVRQNDREAVLTSGSGVLFAGHDSWEQGYRTDVDCVFLQFPRESLGLSAVEVAGISVRPLSGENAGMRLLAGYVDQMYKMVPELSPQQRCDAGQAAVNLLMMALRDVGPAVPDAPDTVLLRVMREYVREHAGDAGLTVEDLARRHALSVRHLYALFARIDLTPAAFIREQRLLKARTMLLDRRHDIRSIPAIAASSGFTEPRTFERAFLREYGSTPARWRRDNR
jgi:AraC-like DNA-binding protein